MRFCTRNRSGRIIYRWEDEEILEEMRERVRREKDKVKLRNFLTEHIFGTMKRNFNQEYMLLKRKDKLGAEMALTVLAYNITRVLNIVGLERLKSAVYRRRVFKNNINNSIKENSLYILGFLGEKLKKIFPLAKINSLYSNFSHSLTLYEIRLGGGFVERYIKGIEILTD